MVQPQMKQKIHRAVAALWICPVGVSLKNLWKPNSINGLQTASKAFILIAIKAERYITNKFLFRILRRTSKIVIS